MKLNGKTTIVKNWFKQNECVVDSGLYKIELVKFGSLADHQPVFLLIVFSSNEYFRYSILGNGMIEDELSILNNYFIEFKKYFSNGIKLHVLKNYSDSKIGIVSN